LPSRGAFDTPKKSTCREHQRVGLESEILQSIGLERIDELYANFEAIIGIIDERPCLQLRPLGQVSPIVSGQWQVGR